MATIDEFLRDATGRMDKSVEATHEHFNSVRTGRATPALLDRITIDYYGTPTPLKNLATINSPEPRMLTIQPFDPSAIKHLEELVKNREVGDDDERSAEARVQKLTDEHTARIDDLLKRKEAEIMEV